MFGVAQRGARALQLTCNPLPHFPRPLRPTFFTNQHTHTQLQALAAKVVTGAQMSVLATVFFGEKLFTVLGVSEVAWRGCRYSWTDVHWVWGTCHICHVWGEWSLERSLEVVGHSNVHCWPSAAP